VADAPTEEPEETLELVDGAVLIPLVLGVAEAADPVEDPVDDPLPVEGGAGAALVELPEPAAVPVEHVTAEGRFVTPAIPQKFRAKETAVF
jgi:hypothetical protein